MINTTNLKQQNRNVNRNNKKEREKKMLRYFSPYLWLLQSHNAMFVEKI